MYVKAVSLSFMLPMILYFISKINNEFIEQAIHKLKTKEEYKFILDRLEHSIITVQNGQIEFVNTKFLN